MPRMIVVALLAFALIVGGGVGFAIGRATATSEVTRYCPRGAVLKSQPDGSVSAPGCVDAPGR